jgi:D-aminoacyl-tRNA deacylase
VRIIVQRVSRAVVTIAGRAVGRTGPGWLALVGVAPTDTPATAASLALKVAQLRAFPDEAGQMNRSVLDIAGGVLAVSNFTLYADTRKGRRPSFIGAARPEVAQPIYEHFVLELRKLGVPTETGEFGADMQIELVNDGPVTMILDSPAPSAPITPGD